MNTLLAEGGLIRQELAADEVREVEPALQGDILGGFLTPSDSSGDIHKFTMGLAKACARRGATLRFGAQVEGVRAEDGVVHVTETQGYETFDAVVVSAGIQSRAFAKQLGDRVNIYPVKGYSVTVNLEDEASQAAAPWVSMLDDRAKIVASRFGQTRFRIAGTAEFNGANRDIRADRIKPLVDWCEQYFPGVCTENVVPWAGLRPMMPSVLPRVGQGRAQGVFYNTGHGHLGWTLSAATARLVSEQVAQRLAPSRATPVQAVPAAA